MATAGWQFRDDGDGDGDGDGVGAVTTAGAAGSADDPVAARDPPVAAVGDPPIADPPIAAVGDPPVADNDLDLEGAFNKALSDNAPPVADDGQPLRPTPPATPPPANLVRSAGRSAHANDTRRVRSPSPAREATVPSAISTTRPKKRPKQLAANI